MHLLEDMQYLLLLAIDSVEELNRFIEEFNLEDDVFMRQGREAGFFSFFFSIYLFTLNNFRKQF